MKIFWILAKQIRKYPFLVVLAMLMSVYTIISNMGLLAFSSILISRAALHPDVLDLMVLIVAVRFFGISRAASRYAERYFTHDTTFRIVSSLRQWFYSSFRKTFSGAGNLFRSGEIFTHMVNDVESLKEFYLRGMNPILAAICIGFGTTLFLTFFSKAIGILFLVFYLWNSICVPYIIGKKSHDIGKDGIRLKEELNICLLDALNGLQEIKSFGLETEKKRILEEWAEKDFQIQKKKILCNGLGEHSVFLWSHLAAVGSIFISIPFMIQGRVDATYLAMIPLTILSAFEAVQPLTNLYPRFEEIKEAGTRIFNIIEKENRNREVSKAETDLENWDLNIENITVQYDEESIALEEISINIPYGKKVGIVGESGAGKSSLVEVLLGFLKYNKGEITMGGLKYKDLSIEQIRTFYTVVEQNPYFFHGTIKENLGIANLNFTQEEMEEATDKAQIHDFIKALPENFNTYMGEGGHKVSGGQRQRLAIARALMKKSPILILDEPTAGLDAATEQQLIYSIKEFWNDKTCIWITHRFLAMEEMDEILVLHKGVIVERGTHSSLLKKKGKYYDMWNIQQQWVFEKEE